MFDYITTSAVCSARKRNSFIEIKVGRLHMRAIAECPPQIVLVLFELFKFFYILYTSS